MSKKPFVSERITEIQPGLFLMEMDDFEKKICKVEGDNWYIALKFPKRRDDGSIKTQYKDRNLNNSQIEYLKKNYDEVVFKKYTTDLGYWIVRKTNK
jgi:hypothetical protein